MRLTIVCLLCLGALAAVPAVAAPVASHYDGTTGQGRAVSFNLRKDGTAKRVTSYRIRWTSVCAGSSSVYRAAAKLDRVAVVGGRFAGEKSGVEAPAGSGQVARTSLSLHGAFAKGGRRVTGRWHARTRIVDVRSDQTVLRCRSGLIHWSAARAPAASG